MTREAQVSPGMPQLWNNQPSLPDGLPSVPVFDRTLPVKQMHVLEALDLLVLRADKGAALRGRSLERTEGGWPTAADLRVTFLGLLSVSFGGPLVGVVEGRRVYAVARIPEHPQPRSVHLPWEALQVI